jgi:predicted transcriptional regulator
LAGSRGNPQQLEANILLVVWDKGEVTNREVHEIFLVEELKKKDKNFIPYTTIMSIMNNLVRKKILKKNGSQRAYTYSAKLSRKELAKSIIQSVTEKLL